MQRKYKDSFEATNDWKSLIDPIPKLAVPVEFIKHIVFHYPNGKEIVLDLTDIDDNFRDTLEGWVETHHRNAEKISMVVDIKKVQAFIEPMTQEFLNGYFS
jgi:hypothetical protein